MCPSLYRKAKSCSEFLLYVFHLGTPQLLVEWRHFLERMERWRATPLSRSSGVSYIIAVQLSTFYLQVLKSEIIGQRRSCYSALCFLWRPPFWPWHVDFFALQPARLQITNAASAIKLTPASSTWSAKQVKMNAFLNEAAKTKRHVQSGVWSGCSFRPAERRLCNMASIKVGQLWLDVAHVTIWQARIP